MTTSFRKTLVLAAAALGVAGGGMAANAAPAAASTVALDGPTLTYDAAPGEANRVTVTQAGGVLTVTDTGATVTAGSGCSVVTSTKATCPATGVAAMASPRATWPTPPASLARRSQPPSPTAQATTP